MTVYVPAPEPWHDSLPGQCECMNAWKRRGMVDDRCEWHRLLFAVEDLQSAGWTLRPGK